MRPLREATEGELDALMARLADGDRSAFDPLYMALYPRAARLARARVDAAMADDVAQSAMLKVFSRAAEFEGGRAVLPWFYAVVANELRAVTRGAMRKASVPIEGDAQAERAASGDDPEGSALTRELEQCLARAIEELDAPSADAIAAMLGHGERPVIEGATFRKRVSRAYARLRLLLGGAYGK